MDGGQGVSSSGLAALSERGPFSGLSGLSGDDGTFGANRGPFRDDGAFGANRVGVAEKRTIHPVVPLWAIRCARGAGRVAKNRYGSARGRGGRSEEGTTRRRGSLLALHLPGWRRASGAALHGGRVVAQVAPIPACRCTIRRCRVAAAAACVNAEDRLYHIAPPREARRKGENRSIGKLSESTTSATFRRPLRRKPLRTPRRFSATPQSAGADTRPRVPRASGLPSPP